MKKLLLAATGALLANALYITQARADTWLVILAGYDTNGLYHPAHIRYYGGDYSAELCMQDLERIATGWHKPAFSYCTINEPDQRYVR